MPGAAVSEGAGNAAEHGAALDTIVDVARRKRAARRHGVARTLTDIAPTFS